jgi:hypothetical protein
VTTAEMSRTELAQLLTAAVGDAFTAFTAQVQGQRADLYALTMSGLGGCTRQGAYRVAGTEPSEELRFGQMREANIGTMIHLGLLPHMADRLDGTEEIDVELATDTLTIKGRSDLYIPGLRLVADLKTVGLYKFGMLGDTANRAHRLQVAGYALAVLQSGQPVEWIAWVYLDRSSGAEHIVVEPWSEDLVELVEGRCEQLAMFAETPDAAPRDERGPGLSVICDGCPWLRACWGEDARPGEIGAQKILARDHGGVERALRLYDDARAREKEAKSDKEFARAMFSDYQTGKYGEFEFGWSSAGEADDKDAAVELLAQAGIPVPRKETARRLIVKRAR